MKLALFIGPKDDGKPSDLSITEDLLIIIANMKTDGQILPLPVFSVEKRKLCGSEMVVVTVMPSEMPPVKFDGRIWIRTGPRRAIANHQEERILNEKIRYKNIPFDVYPVSSAKISNLSKSIFENDYLPTAFASDVLEVNHRTYEERLASCKMISNLSNSVPTVLGTLSVGTDPQDFLLGAYIQFLRISGTEIEDSVID
jgi:ATP-dependent DNA helicase RecG